MILGNLNLFTVVFDLTITDKMMFYFSLAVLVIMLFKFVLFLLRKVSSLTPAIWCFLTFFYTIFYLVKCHEAEHLILGFTLLLESIIIFLTVFIKMRNYRIPEPKKASEDEEEAEEKPAEEKPAAEEPAEEKPVETKPADASGVNKSFVVEFLKGYGDEVIINSRPNYANPGRGMTEGLLMPDTHYYNLGKGKKNAFAYVYEPKDASVTLKIKTSVEHFEKIKKEHPSAVPSDFPKKLNGNKWYSLVMDSTYTEDDIKEILSEVVELAKTHL